MPPQIYDSASENNIVFTPSDFVAVFNQAIDYAFGKVIVEGEVANFRLAKNMWVYFDIKDSASTLKCFASKFSLSGPVENGMVVKIVATPRLHQLYNFSLTVENLSAVGEGSIAKQAELLRVKLSLEGLFDPERKRPIRYAPRKIALLTAENSAAYSDFVKITKSRWPMLEIDFYPTYVQGLEAPQHIVTRIHEVNQNGREYDALVLIRGGGSADDLSAFQDERVTRAVAGSKIVTVVAIGHEVDESLAEMASDLRASTPSNAAELLVPDMHEEARLAKSTQQLIHRLIISARDKNRASLTLQRSGLLHVISSIVNKENHELISYGDRLRVMDPRMALKRGYVLVFQGNRMVKSVHETTKNDVLEIRFHDGAVQVEVQ